MPALLEFCAKGFHEALTLTEVPLVRAPGRPVADLARLPMKELRMGTRVAAWGRDRRGRVGSGSDVIIRRADAVFPGKGDGKIGPRARGAVVARRRRTMEATADMVTTGVSDARVADDGRDVGRCAAGAPGATELPIGLVPLAESSTNQNAPFRLGSRDGDPTIPHFVRERGAVR